MFLGTSLSGDENHLKAAVKVQSWRRAGTGPIRLVAAVDRGGCAGSKVPWQGIYGQKVRLAVNC